MRHVTVVAVREGCSWGWAVAVDGKKTVSDSSQDFADVPLVLFTEDEAMAATEEDA